METVEYVRGDRAALPVPDSSVDVVSGVWAELDLHEADRVLWPGGLVIQMGSAPGSLCGALSPILAEDYPDLITDLVSTGRSSGQVVREVIEQLCCPTLAVRRVIDAVQEHALFCIGQSRARSVLCELDGYSRE